MVSQYNIREESDIMKKRIEGKHRFRYMNTSQFICTECGLEMPLQRPHCHQREKGHIKDLDCPKCRKKTKFKEIRYNDFYKTMSGEILKN